MLQWNILLYTYLIETVLPFGHSNPVLLLFSFCVVSFRNDTITDLSFCWIVHSYFVANFSVWKLKSLKIKLTGTKQNKTKQWSIDMFLDQMKWWQNSAIFYKLNRNRVLVGAMHLVHSRAFEPRSNASLICCIDMQFRCVWPKLCFTYKTMLKHLINRWIVIPCILWLFVTLIQLEIAN